MTHAIPLASAIATIDGEISLQGRQLHRAECDRHEARAKKIEYAMVVLRHVRSAMYDTVGVEEFEWDADRMREFERECAADERRNELETK